MSYVAKLLYRDKELDLNAGRYELAQDFRPLAINLAPRRRNESRRLQLDDPTRTNRTWNFGIHLNGSSDAELHRALEDLQYFLNQALDDNFPVYLGYKPNNDVTYEPTWGQTGGLVRYEIIEGRVMPSNTYGTGNLRSLRLINNRVELVVKPVAIGLKQRVGQAAGGVLEDNLFTADGRSRGVIVPEATINEVSNPIFGNATWNTGWTDGADLTDTENTDPAYILYGFSSAKLTATGGSTNTYTISVTAPNTNTHAFSFYAKLTDGSAVSATHVTMDYAGSGLTETYTSVGNGWYRVWATAAGVASSQNFRIIVAAEYTIYVDGVQVEEAPYPSTLAHGDMMGVAWSGTAHASDSTRTAGKIDLSEPPDVASFTIRVAWLAPAGSASVADPIHLFSDNNGSIELRYSTGSSDWVFQDGTNEARTGAAQTFSQGDKIILHATASAATGLDLYLNGTSVATNATYTVPTIPTSIFIGSSESSTLHANGTIMGFTQFNRALSAAEVLADYNNLSQLTADDNRVDYVPWEWTKDGDSTVDSCIESGSSIETVFGGIPGSGRAITRALVEFTSTGGTGAFMTVIPLRNYYTAEDVIFHDAQGTVTSSTDCGGEVDRSVWGTTINTSRWTVAVTTRQLLEYLSGKDAYTLIRIPTKAGADNISVFVRFRWAGNNIDSDRLEVSATGNHLVAPIPFYRFKDVFMEAGLGNQLNSTLFDVRGGHVGAGTGNVDIDYILVSPNPILKMDLTTSGVDYFIIEGLNVKETTNNTYNAVRDDVDTIGDANGIDLYPEAYNMVCAVPSHTIANTLVWNQVFITPRYALV